MRGSTKKSIKEQPDCPTEKEQSGVQDVVTVKPEKSQHLPYLFCGKAEVVNGTYGNYIRCVV